MYAVLIYDQRQGWKVLHKYADYTLALIAMNDFARLSPDERFDINYVPSKRKAKKVTVRG